VGIFGKDSDKEQPTPARNIQPASNVQPDSNVQGGAGSTVPATPPASAGFVAPRYIVAKGDSLSKIAQRAYGDGTKWRKIYEANKDIIKDPDLIYPGQALNIPE
jgi:nucleoid-associated protein YgaU